LPKKKTLKSSNNLMNRGSDNILRTFAFLLFLFAPCFSDTTSVQYIPARDYFQTVSAEINSARHSIHAILYLFSLYPNSPQSGVMRLANALVTAHNRGCDVHVVLDKGDFSAKHGDLAEPGDNRNAYEYLTARGIPTGFADVSAIVHAKAIVVDSETVIFGSANWSESALSRNLETNGLVRDRHFAQALLREFGTVAVITLPTRDSGAVALPMTFFAPDTQRIAARMVRSNDERAYDLYLYFRHIAASLSASDSSFIPQPSSFLLNYDSCAAQLGILSMGNVAYRRQINKVLDKLQDRYGLVSAARVYGKDAQVRFTGAHIDTAQETVSVPAAYWDFGWARRLGFPAKVMYVLGRYYSSVSLSRPKWTMAATTIAARHGLTRWFVETGTISLRRANLLDVDYDEQNPDGPRHSNGYTPLPLYDPAQLEARWTALEIRY
jgi:hypothetical protein